MEELAAQYQQQSSMDDLAFKYQQQQPIDNPNQLPVTDNKIDYNKMLQINMDDQPSLADKFNAITMGTHRGVTSFTHNLLAMIPGMKDRVAAADKVVQKEYEQAKQKAPGYAIGGEIAGEVLATLPAGGALGLIGKGATALGKVLPTGLKTLGKYGASMLGGAGTLAGTELLRYDPENPGQLNTTAAKEALASPVTYAVPALATKLGTWANSAKQLGEAQQVIPSMMARDVKPSGATRTLAQEVFDSLPALTGMGKRVRQMETIGDDITNYIKNLAGNLQVTKYKDLKAEAGQQLQNSLKVLKLKGNLLWEKGFKNNQISNPQEVYDNVNDAVNLISGSKIKGESLIKTYLGNSVPKTVEADLRGIGIAAKGKKLTVDDVKELATYVQKAAINARRVEGGAGMDLANKLDTVHNNLFDSIQKSISPSDMADFSAAREYSANLFNMYKQVPKLQKAATDEAAARNVILKIVGEQDPFNKKVVTDIMGDKGLKATQAAKIAKALEQSDTPDGVNLNTFLNKTSEYTQTPEILGSENYKAFEGFRNYLSAIRSGGKVGWWRQAAMLTAATGAVGAGFAFGDEKGALMPIATYAAMSLVANHSPLKKIFNAMTKDLPEPTFNALMKAAERHLSRAGYFMSQDGVMKNKDEDQVNE